jgi:ribokinase
VDAGPAQAFPLDGLADAWLVSPNETEAGALLGEPFSGLAAAREAARKLVLAGLPRVLLKLGSDGALLAQCSDDAPESVAIHHFPAFRVDAVDTTAAGDAFTAALGIRLAQGEPLERAIIFANAAGALTATRLGAQPSLPTAAEVGTFLKERGVSET